LPAMRIDHRGVQEQVLQQIASAVATVAGDPMAQSRLAHLMGELAAHIQTCSTSSTAALISDFGAGGAEQVAALIETQARKETSDARL
jgi:hypothetical protein